MRVGAWSDPGALALDTERQGGRTRVRAAGEIDLTSAGALGDALSAAIAGSERVVVDLTDVEFFDCRGLNALIRARHEARRAGSQLLVDGASDVVMRVVDLSRLTDVLLAGPATSPR